MFCKMINWKKINIDWFNSLLAGNKTKTEVKKKLNENKSVFIPPYLLGYQ